jgi:hypothetical protein
MKNTILALLVLVSISARAEARPRKAYHCFYLVSNKTGDVESACYASNKTCTSYLRMFAKAFKIQPPDGCFISRETQEITVPTSCAKPLHVILPNYASCLESYRFHLQSGESPTFCHPTESK